MTRSILLLSFCLALAFTPALAQKKPDDKTSSSATQKTFFPVTGAPATLANVVLSAIKYGMLDTTSDQAIDDFAQLEYCDIFTQYRSNEFDWRKVRVAMRKKIELDKANYPDTMYLERTEIFGQYDFNTSLLALKPTTALHTSSLQLAEVQISDSYCGQPLTHMPKQFIAALSEQLNLDGIELSEDEAQRTVAEMDIVPGKPDERLGYSRFTVTFQGGGEPGLPHGTVKLNSKLNDVTMYLDADYAHPFWSGLSSASSSHMDKGGPLDTIIFKGIDPKPDKAVAPQPLPDVGPIK